MSHVHGRRVATAVTAVLVLTGLAAIPSRATASFALTRIAGPDRYETAANTAPARCATCPSCGDFSPNSPSR